ncbi:MAG: DUF2061 domain-containing protein [Candidatus Diapherotrites archaeon]|nr:DUF2061 domain-containing protein [Candidatus Diapherotrites archaeon]
MFPDTQISSASIAIKKGGGRRWDASAKLKEGSKPFVQLPLSISPPPIQFGYDNSFELIRGLTSMERAVKKSISFRVFATMGTFAVAWVFTGNPFTSIGLASAQAITNTTIYYWHEKHWEGKSRSQKQSA